MTKTREQVTCVGCGILFTPTGPNHKRCTTRCSWHSPHRTHKAKSLASTETQFIAVDGEGITLPDGTHRYVLLSVGDQSLQADDGNALNLHDIFPFLWAQYLKHPEASFVGYYLSYDFSQWFKDIPEERARMLFTNAGRAVRQPKSKLRFTPFPVRFAGWEFDFLGLRRFKLRPEGYDKGWLFICDAGPFWQTSFLSAIDPKNWDEPICTPEQYELIRQGKENRSTAQLDKTMIKYNVMENKILADVMYRLDQGFRTQQWVLKKTQWFGPGQVAQQWLRAVGAPSSAQIADKTPSDVIRAAQASYYGGWFEIPRHGHISGESYEYDINSAYPYAIAQLPCLMHGRWQRTAEGPHVLQLVDTVGSDRYLGGLPHRDKDGIISRPLMNSGWYWQAELQAAQRAGLIDTVQVRESWAYVPCDCPRPLRMIADLYHQRQRVGKDTPHGKALKLVYNSAYGKFAQSIGEPRYANPVYASMITSQCRTMILDAIATHPGKSQAVLMIATDGIYFSRPHTALTVGASLGEWSAGSKLNLTLFMPGVYWDDKSRQALRDGEAVKLKSRGISGSDLSKHIEHIDREFGSFYGAWPEVSIPIAFSVISPMLALARNDWTQCGRIMTYEHDNLGRDLSANPSNKRQPTAYWDDGIITTSPYVDRGTNHGYDKTFGMVLEQLNDNDEYITDDGPIARELYETLKGD